MTDIGDVIRLESVVIVAVYVGMTASIFQIMHNANPEPYMDEIFHIPQAQKYCKGSFNSYDPKITTLPGLYLFSSGLLASPLSTCSVFNLRMVNFLFAMGNFYVIYQLVRQIQGYAPSAAAFTAFTLCHFPILHFFTFFYYTDTGSVFLVLLMYLLSLQERHVSASLIGYIAIMFRQTNVVWVFFTAMVAASDAVFEIIEDLMEFDLPNVRLFIVAKNIVSEFISDFFSHIAHGEEVQRGVNSAALTTVKALLIDLFGALWSYGLVGLGFILFLFCNGGIVVGDKSAHVSVFHLPQLFYFAAFTVFFASPHIINHTNIRSAWRTLRNRPKLVIVSVVVSELGVGVFSHAHPYLLADNRHYTFYLWRKVFMSYSIIRFALVPGYVMSLILMHRALNHMNVAWRSLYFFCVFITLVPQQLLEFRYFIIPYMIFRIHLLSPNHITTIIEWLLYLTIDITTIALYIYKPFKWEGSEDLQRFMW